jgi:hypothetical protein
MLFETLIAIAMRRLPVTSLAATSTALASQSYFGRSASFAAIGTLLAAFGAASFAFWLKERR